MNANRLAALPLPLVGLTAFASAQQQQWEIPGPGPSLRQWFNLSAFGDFDGDGVRDFLVESVYNPTYTLLIDLEIRSGRNASILWSMQGGAILACYDAGDCDGDGEPDILLVRSTGPRWIEVWSTRTRSRLWWATTPGASAGIAWGEVILGDIDLNGDGLKDVLVGSRHSNNSTLYAFDNAGNLLYSRDYLAIGRVAASACNMGDTNGDGREDFLLGCTEPTGRGMLTLTSGLDCSDLHITYGLQPGDHMSDHATRLGDIDGDGVDDYMGFPAWFTANYRVAQFSGATGNLIRSWIDYANSVVAGPDFDLDRDGVPDLVICNSLQVAQNTYGRTRAISGRDGTELWHVDAQPSVLGSCISPGTQGWGYYSASLGTAPGRAYPALTWIETEYHTCTSLYGRVRAFGTELLGQGPVTGSPCSTTGQPPLIGARNTATGARVTIAHAPPGAIALLNVATAAYHKQNLAVLPVSAAAFGIDCDILVLPEASVARLVGAAQGIDLGYAAVDLPFLLTPFTTGIDLVAQWLVLDPITLGFASTELHHLHGG